MDLFCRNAREIPYIWQLQINSCCALLDYHCFLLQKAAQILINVHARLCKKKSCFICHFSVFCEQRNDDNTTWKWQKSFVGFTYTQTFTPGKSLFRREKKATGVWLVAGGTSQKERWDIAKGDILQEKSSSGERERDVLVVRPNFFEVVSSLLHTNRYTTPPLDQTYCRY